MKTAELTGVILATLSGVAVASCGPQVDVDDPEALADDDAAGEDEGHDDSSDFPAQIMLDAAGQREDARAQWREALSVVDELAGPDSELGREVRARLPEGAI